MARARVCPICQRTVTGPCPDCAKRDEDQKESAQARDAARGSAASRGYGHKWRIESKKFLRLKENRICFYCQQKDPPKITTSTVVDHFIPHRGNKKLFWDRKNWRGSCKTCHDKKTRSGR